ncbi:MAG: hypothetical protein JW755_03395 [Candidatus Aminicenantes bacterium]|nr:hypothetical protein [Candidatus Aminicenantes bacterium]
MVRNIRKSILLLILLVFITSGCSTLFKKPEVDPPVFQVDIAQLSPESYPARIEQLELIAENNESVAMRNRARVHLALIHSHYNNPAPDYAQAITALDNFEAAGTDVEVINEINTCAETLRRLDTLIRNYEKLEKDYALLKEENEQLRETNERLNKDWHYANQEGINLNKTIAAQKKEIVNLKAKIKELDSLYLEIEKKKKKK